MRISTTIASLGVCLMLCELARGNNNYFLPGDAFFPTRLAEKDLDRLKAGSKDGPAFDYSSLGGYDAAFCGFAGYRHARFAQVDQAFIDNLKRAYRRVRRFEPKALQELDNEGKKSLEETNGVGVLFYPADYDFPKYRLGLQYNEGWLAEVERFGHEQRHSRLCCLVETADAVMECWRDATAVAALKADLPEAEPKPGHTIDEPIVVREKVQAFVVDSRPLKKYFDLPEDDAVGVTLLRVDSSGITELIYDHDEWKREEVAK